MCIVELKTHKTETFYYFRAACRIWVNLRVLDLHDIKTHPYFIFFVRPLHSKPWRVIVDQVQTNHHGWPMVL